MGYRFFTFILAAAFILATAKAEEKTDAKKDDARPAAAPEATESRASKFSHESLIDSDGWDFEISQYLWASAIKSKISIGDTTSESDVKFGDLLDHLKFAGTLHAEARNGRWGIFADLNYAKLGEATEKRVGEGLKRLNIDVKVDFEQTLAEAGGFYRFGGDKHAFDLLGGGRYIYMGTDVDVGPLGVGADKDWFDPFVGGRYVTKLTDRWAFTLRGDVGGFGVGTDLTWNAVAMFRYRMTKHSEIGFGYRHMDIDAGDDDGSFESVMTGPMIGMGFRF
ncbi:MAG TPA: hypothetical protein PLJ47_13170 [Candidatus Hydrogenedentes bacterium]|nr:hypothetical protein [Candidatus Hydrogenedentota bacterium]